MDRVIETALLAAATSQKENPLEDQPAEIAEPPEPRPLHLDERTIPARKRKVRASVTPTDVQNEQDINAPEPFMIPPTDLNITGDSYPQLQARKPEES